MADGKNSKPEWTDADIFAEWWAGKRDAASGSPDRHRTFASRLRLLIGELVKRGDDESLRAMERAERALARVRSNEDLANERDLLALRAVRKGGTGRTPYAVTVAALRATGALTGALEGWTDLQILRVLKADNMNRVAATVLGELHRGTSESNVEQRIRRGKKKSKARQ